MPVPSYINVLKLVQPPLHPSLRREWGGELWMPQRLNTTLLITYFTYYTCFKNIYQVQIVDCVNELKWILKCWEKWFLLCFEKFCCKDLAISIANRNRVVFLRSWGNVWAFSGRILLNSLVFGLFEFYFV